MGENCGNLGGPPPGFPQKEHFLCGTSTEKASREGPNIQRKCHGGPRPAHELHPLQRGNRYMSRRRRVIPVGVHAPTLADFRFALIPARIFRAAPP
jgi:hypothetical protein